MVLVGTFNEDELRAKKDKEAVEYKMKETGLKYTHTKMTKKGLTIWVCNVDEADFT